MAYIKLVAALIIPKGESENDQTYDKEIVFATRTGIKFSPEKFDEAVNITPDSSISGITANDLKTALLPTKEIPHETN